MATMTDDMAGLRRSSGTLRLMLIIGAVGVVAVVALAVVRGMASTPTVAQRGPHPVRVALVAHDDGTRELRASGVTVPIQHAALPFGVPGRLLRTHVSIGDEVEAGEMLAELDPRAARNAFEAARATEREARAHVGQARRQTRRSKVLLQDDALSRQTYDDTRFGLAAGRARRAAARSQSREAARMLDEAQLIAPFAGVITDVLLEPGEFAQHGQPVIVLSGVEGVKVEVEVPESHIHRIEEGAEVRVDLPLAGIHDVRGTVHAVVRSAGIASRQFPVEIRLDPQSRVLPGMAAEVVFRTQEEEGLTVPVASVVNPGGDQASVFVVRQGKAVRVPVEVRDLLGGQVVVTGGLEAGDRVIVGGHSGLVDGEPVAAHPTESTEAQGATDLPSDGPTVVEEAEEAGSAQADP